MIDWGELRSGLSDKGFPETKYNGGDDKAAERLQYLGEQFDHLHNDGLLILSLAVVKQWLIDRRPVTEYAYVRPWLEYIQLKLPGLYIDL